MFNIETALIKWARAALGVPCYAIVPADAPGRFVTVERTGGGTSLGVDRPVVAFQCWAASRLEASELASALRSAIVTGARSIPEVCGASVSSTYDFPDPETRRARYQVVAEFTTRI